MDTQNAVQESARAKRRGLFVQLGANVEDSVRAGCIQTPMAK